MIVKDLIQSHTLRRSSAGYGVDRIFIVSDVSGTPESRLYNATIRAGIPQFGDPHPVIPDIQVTDIQASPESNDSESVRVSVTYSIPSDEDSEGGAGDLAAGVPVVSSSLNSEDTILDINGDWIKVQYFGNSTLTTKYEEITVQRPQMRVALTRTESTLPKSTIAKYLGSVNSTAWSGFAAKTWLCANIGVRQFKGEWEVEYSFAYRADTWRAVVTTQIPATVIEDYPPDVQSGNGYAVFDVYPVKDFNLLGLKF